MVCGTSTVTLPQIVMRWPPSISIRTIQKQLRMLLLEFLKQVIICIPF